MAKGRRHYKVTYAGTRAHDSFATKREAVAQARFAVKIGNTRSCVTKLGDYLPLVCITRRKRRKRR